MKKIIYSLVIMIAAGSLFTSCIENQESTGQRAVQQAKAEYLEALANLRTADAAVQNANAELIKAQAAVQTAIAAQEAAQAQYMQLVNELKEAQNEAAKAELEAKIAEIQAQAEIDAVNAQAELLEAVQALEKLENEIEVAAAQMTEAEQKAIQDAYEAYTGAARKYLDAVEEYNTAVVDLYEMSSQKGSVQIEDQQAKIARYEKKIAKAQESIEALQTSAEAVAEVIAGYEEEITTIKAEIVEAVSEKALWYATNWDEAAASYAEAYAAWVKDSLPETTPFYFGGKEGAGWEYELPGTFASQSDMYSSLYSDFSNYMYNNDCDRWGEIKRDKDKKEFDLIIYPTYEKTDIDSLLNGYTDSGDNKYLGLEGIISALERDMVITERDSSFKKELADLKKDAEKADSIYDAQREILAAGLEKWQPYKDSLKKVDDLEDTLIIKSGDSLAAAKAFAETRKGIIDQVATAATGYKTAVKGFVAAVNDIQSGTFASKSKSDSTAFYNAIVALGKAQKAFFGKEDSIVVMDATLKDDFSIEEKTVKVALSELKYEGFVQTLNNEGKGTSLYGGTGYGKFANAADGELKAKAWYSVTNGIASNLEDDAMTKIVRTILGSSSQYSWTAALTGAEKKNIEPGANYSDEKTWAFDIPTDSITWAEGNAQGVKADYKAYEAAAQKAKKAEDAANAVRNAIAAAAANVIAPAEKAYKALFVEFFGIPNWVVEDDFGGFDWKKPYEFNYTRATFEDEDLCMTIGKNSEGRFATIGDKTYDVVVDQLKKTAVEIDGVNMATTVFTWGWTSSTSGDSYGTATAYGKAIYANQIYNAKKNWTSIKEQFENLKAMVAAVEADYNAAVEAASETTAEWKEAMVRLTGKADGTKVEDLSNATIEDGGWVLGGLQKEWAEEFAGDYAVLVTVAEKVDEEGNEMIDYLEGLIEVNKEVWEAAYNIGNKGDWKDLEDVASAIEKFENKIERLGRKIENCEKLIAAIEAGANADALAYELKAEEVEKLALDVEDLAAMVEYYRNLYETLVATYTK